MRRAVKYGHCLCSSPYFRSASNDHTPLGIKLWGSSRSRFYTTLVWAQLTQHVGESNGRTYIVIDADIHIFPSIFLFFDKARSQTSATSINNRATLFPLDRRVKAQVLSTCETKAAKLFFVAQLLGAILHQRLQLDQSLFDLRHCPYRPRQHHSVGETPRGLLTRAVDELSLLRHVLLVRNNERQQRHGLAGSGRHLQDTMATRVKGFYDFVSGWLRMQEFGSYFSNHTCS